MTAAAKRHQYESRLTWTGNTGSGTATYAGYGREYGIEITGKPALEGSADAMFRGRADRHNPEDHFLAAIAGCHMLSYLALCARSGVTVLAYEDAASGTLELDAGGGGRFTDVTLTPRVIVAADADVALAAQLHETAHEQCFIASSCSTPIRCVPTITTASSRG